MLSKAAINYIFGMVFLIHSFQAIATDKSSGFTQVLVKSDDQGRVETARLDVAEAITLTDIAEINKQLDPQYASMNVQVLVPSDLDPAVAEKFRNKIADLIAANHVPIDAVLHPIDVAAATEKANQANKELESFDTGSKYSPDSFKAVAIEHNRLTVATLQNWAKAFPALANRLIASAGSDAAHVYFARFLPLARGSFTAVTWITLGGDTWNALALGTIDVIGDYWLIKNDHLLDSASTSWTKKLGRLSRTTLIKILDKNDVIKASIFGWVIFGTGYRVLQRSVSSVVDDLTSMATQSHFADLNYWYTVAVAGALTWTTRAFGRLGLNNLVQKGYMSPNWRTNLNYLYSFYAQCMAVCLLTNRTEALIATGVIVWVGQPAVNIIANLLPSKNLLAAQKDGDPLMDSQERTGLKKYVQKLKDQAALVTQKLSQFASQCQSTFY